MNELTNDKGISEFDKEEKGEKDPNTHKQTKEMIQTALNLINGIAFGSHEPRFKAKFFTAITPGPGDYYTEECNTTPRYKRLPRKTITESKIRNLIEDRKNPHALGNNDLSLTNNLIISS